MPHTFHFRCSHHRLTDVVLIAIALGKSPQDGFDEKCPGVGWRLTPVRTMAFRRGVRQRGVTEPEVPLSSP